MSLSKSTTLSGGEFISILRQKKMKKKGGFKVLPSINLDSLPVAVIEKVSTKQQKYICIDNSSTEYELDIDDDPNLAIYPHIPLGLERFIIFISGEGGMGKTGLTSFMVAQAKKMIKDIKVFYICGTGVDADQNMRNLKYVVELDGPVLNEIVPSRDFKNSLIVIDDVDNWEYHKDCIKLMNKCYETGRKFNINMIYISHNTTKAQESKIYSEVNMYITNQASNNLMLEKYLALPESTIDEMKEYLKEDIFICYNKNLKSVVTDKRVYKLEE